MLVDHFCFISITVKNFVPDKTFFHNVFIVKISVLDTTLCDKVCQWSSPGTPVSFTNKTDRRDIIEILLKVALNTRKPNQTLTNNSNKSYFL